MKKDMNWVSDLARYPKKPFLKEHSIWAIWVHRWGRRIDKKKEGKYKFFLIKLYWLFFRLIEMQTGISLPKEAKIGSGLRIWHFGNIFVHPQAIIGENFTLRQGVTIGNRVDNGPVPIIGNNVECGAYAQILGGVVIGDNCKIGAMTVVLKDVPSNSTVVGNPGRIIDPEIL